MGVRFSITLRQHKGVRRLIEAILTDAWIPDRRRQTAAADVQDLAPGGFAARYRRR
jgi:hypothetical protein